MRKTKWRKGEKEYSMDILTFILGTLVCIIVAPLIIACIAYAISAICAIAVLVLTVILDHLIEKRSKDKC